VRDCQKKNTSENHWQTELRSNPQNGQAAGQRLEEGGVP